MSAVAELLARHREEETLAERVQVLNQLANVLFQMGDHETSWTLRGAADTLAGAEPWETEYAKAYERGREAGRAMTRCTDDT